MSDEPAPAPTLPATTPQGRRPRLGFCPHFVAELRSPGDKYVSQRARLGWLIDPESGKAEIYRPGRPIVTLDRPATLSGEDVLPGFVLDLKGLLGE